MFLIVHKKKKKHFAKIRTILREKTIEIVQQKKTKSSRQRGTRRFWGVVLCLLRSLTAEGMKLAAMTAYCLPRTG